jgi:hypothetical protein
MGEIEPLALDKLVAGQAGGTQEALDGLVGRADAGPLALLVAFRLGRGQPLGHQRQASGPREGRQRLRQQPLGGQLLARHPLEILRRLRLHARRDLFAKEFE